MIISQKKVINSCNTFRTIFNYRHFDEFVEYLIFKKCLQEGPTYVRRSTISLRYKVYEGIKKA